MSARWPWSVNLRRWRSSLAAKFILLTALVTALVFSTIGAITYYSQRAIEYDRLQVKAQTLASLIASVSPDRIFSHDYSTLHEYVKQLNAFPDVLYAVVYSDSGEPMTSYLDRNKAAILRAINATGGRDAVAVSNFINQLPETEVFTAPILFSEKNIGHITIGISRQGADTAVSHALALDLAVTLVGIGVLALGVYLVFYRYVLHPTQQLMRGAQRVARGDLSSPIPVAGDDELGRLAGSFNDMLGHLRQSDAARALALANLRELNRTLESRVEERTRAIEQASRELERMALYDPLTSLPNRTLMQDRLEHLLQSSARQNAQFAVMIMDLDRFKEVNDTLGHHVGDQLLQQIGKKMVATLHHTDTIARLGGDEFAVVLPDADETQAMAVAARLLDALDEPMRLEGLNCSVDASIGIAIYPMHGTDSATLLKHADVAMYKAKQSSTGYCLYHDDIDRDRPQTFMLTTDLRHALENGDLRLHYQPIVDLRTGQWHAVEALAQWQHRQLGLIAPDRFVPLIEQTGMIRSFTAWVIDTALSQWAQWREQGIELNVAVNLSMRNLQDREFPNLLATLLDRWSASPRALKLEITESRMMVDPGKALEALEQFERMGVGLAIDDFGTGYSSLSYLKRLPVDEIKIDRSFINDMATDSANAMIVQSTIELAHNLGLRVVAEGVESAEVLDMLRTRGCDLAQGYFLGYPVAASELKMPMPIQLGDMAKAAAAAGS